MPDNALTSGLKNIETANSTATVKAVSPVLPPAATPAEDSINAVVGLVPKTAPTVVAVESASSAFRTFGSLLFFISPACSATPIIVPVVSKL